MPHENIAKNIFFDANNTSNFPDENSYAQTSKYDADRPQGQFRLII